MQLPVPDGARLTLFQYWGYDTDSDLDLSYDVYETCQAPAAGPPFVTLLAHASPVLGDGQYFGFAVLSHVTADTKNCSYSVRVLFAPVGHECVQGGLEVEKLQIVWVRQVSPAPDTATFNDVPTSHPFFQFVEALAKSGITGGCNTAPPLYCPGRAPDTRTDGRVPGEGAGAPVAMKRRARIHTLIVAAAGCSVSLLGQQADQVRKTYGISQESLVRIGPMQFAPVQSTTPYSVIGSPSFTRYATGGDGVFVASPSLPSGALVTFVQFDVCDINVADDITVFISLHGQPRAKPADSQRHDDFGHDRLRQPLRQPDACVRRGQRPQSAPAPVPGPRLRRLGVTRREPPSTTSSR